MSVTSIHKHQSDNQAQWFELLDKHADLSAQARHIAEKINPLAPISQLPMESLYAIFMILAHMHDETQPRSLHFSSDSEERFEGRMPWTDYARDIRRASQVNRAWRNLALKSPTLWNAPLECVGPRQWGVELLRRCGPSPLNIVVDTEHTFQNWLPKFVIDNLSRIERLLVHMVVAQPGAKSVVKQINERAVTLKDLVLTDFYDATDNRPLDLSEDEIATGNSEDYYDEIPFLHVDKHCCPPNLRSLSLGGFMFPVESPIYLGLTSLRIDGFANPALDVTGWCSFLPKLENLTSLSLFECVWRGGTGNNLPPVSLPSLRTFKISGSKSAGLLVAHLFKRVIPALNVLDVYVRGFRPDENFDLLMEVLFELLSQHAVVAEQTTLFQYLYTHGVTISDRHCKTRGEDYQMRVRIHGRFENAVGRKRTPLPFLQRLFTSEALRKYAPIPDIVQPVSHQVLAILTIPFADLSGIEITHISRFQNLRKLLHKERRLGLVPLFPLSLSQVKEIIVQEMDWQVCSWYTGFKDFIQWRDDAGIPVQTLRFSPTWRENLGVAESYCKELGKSRTHVIFENNGENENDLQSDDEIAHYFPNNDIIMMFY
ncbi:hypothetical protein CPB83DRAFT_851777 [Crepidotus variabilis]|uniref:F-box domain-containing protein n=1 Tax=Crepidotus variabilis TaxID=179855 RepID=A0A9P6EJ93_9AGAR|nr:hypothetical protein CPB83DRAFT_851777 [Crepidotus variabilis]